MTKLSLRLRVVSVFYGYLFLQYNLHNCRIGPTVSLLIVQYVLLSMKLSIFARVTKLIALCCGFVGGEQHHEDTVIRNSTWCNIPGRRTELRMDWSPKELLDGCLLKKYVTVPVVYGSFALVQ